MTHVKASRRERIGDMTFRLCKLDQRLAEDRRRLAAPVVIHQEIQIRLLLRVGAEHGYGSANKGAVAICHDGKPSRVVVVVVGGMPSDGGRLFGGRLRELLITAINCLEKIDQRLDRQNTRVLAVSIGQLARQRLSDTASRCDLLPAQRPSIPKPATEVINDGFHGV